MRIFHLNSKRILAWILVMCQVFLLSLYFIIQSQNGKESPKSLIQFLKNSKDNNELQMTYHTLKSNIILKTVNTRQSYIDFNSSLCFKNGTDLNLMKTNRGVNWKCNCLPGWHGNDCGWPEVLWRAVLANNKPLKIKGPRIFERRIIYIFKVDQYSEHVADMRINDLGSIVDLFILYEDDYSDYFKKKLDSNYFKEYQHKILYVNYEAVNLWRKVKLYLKNLRNDDIILSSELNELPNKNALIFLKFYDHWPQPIKFRNKWSVFGFFWLHPTHTITTGGACTVSFLKEFFSNNIKLLTDNKTLSNPAYRGLILGDLNHYGGWYCEYCNDPAKIVEYLASKPTNVINWDKIEHQKIDKSYIEDLIENGIYIDGKTQLKNTHRFSDSYFAPNYVIQNDLIFDFLLINFYSKNEYYDG